jgi:hypothetical protein
MTTIMVKLYDKWDDEFYIRVPVGKPKRQKAAVKHTVMERAAAWWAAIKAQEAAVRTVALSTAAEQVGRLGR